MPSLRCPSCECTQSVPKGYSEPTIHCGVCWYELPIPGAAPKVALKAVPLPATNSPVLRPLSGASGANAQTAALVGKPSGEPKFSKRDPDEDDDPPEYVRPSELESKRQSQSVPFLLSASILCACVTICAGMSYLGYTAMTGINQSHSYASNTPNREMPNRNPSNSQLINPRNNQPVNIEVPKPNIEIRNQPRTPITTPQISPPQIGGRPFPTPSTPPTPTPTPTPGIPAGPGFGSNPGFPNAPGFPNTPGSPNFPNPGVRPNPPGNRSMPTIPLEYADVSIPGLNAKAPSGQQIIGTAIETVDGTIIRAKSARIFAINTGYNFNAKIFDLPGEMKIDDRGIIQRMSEAAKTISGPNPALIDNQPAKEYVFATNTNQPIFCRVMQVGQKFYLIYMKPFGTRRVSETPEEMAKTFFESVRLVDDDTGGVQQNPMPQPGPGPSKPPVPGSSNPQNLYATVALPVMNSAVPLSGEGNWLTFSHLNDGAKGLIGEVRRYANGEERTMARISLSGAPVAAAASEQCNRLIVVVANPASTANRTPASVEAQFFSLSKVAEATGHVEAMSAPAKVTLSNLARIHGLHFTADGHKAYLLVSSPLARGGRLIGWQSKLYVFDPIKGVVDQEIQLSEPMVGMALSGDNKTLALIANPLNPKDGISIINVGVTSKLVLFDCDELKPTGSVRMPSPMFQVAAVGDSDFAVLSSSPESASLKKLYYLRPGDLDPTDITPDKFDGMQLVSLVATPDGRWLFASSGKEREGVLAYRVNEWSRAGLVHFGTLNRAMDKPVGGMLYLADNGHSLLTSSGHIVPIPANAGSN